MEACCEIVSVKTTQIASTETDCETFVAKLFLTKREVLESNLFVKQKFILD